MSRTRTLRNTFGGKPLMGVGLLAKTYYGNARRGEIATCTDEVHSGPPYRSGSGLDISKREFTSHPSVYTSLRNTPYAYAGQFYLEPPSPNTAIPSAIDLTGWGAKGYNRGLPIHNELNLTQFLGEMKDVPEMIRSSKEFFSSFRRLDGRSHTYWSEAFVNHQFGWAPFINDLYNIFQLQKRLADRVNWIRKNNGRRIKRSFTLASGSTDTLVSRSESNFGVLQPAMATYVYPTIISKPYGGYIETRQQTKYRIWFVGSFAFFVPESELAAPLGSTNLTAMLTGTLPDMSQVWKLTPWSWLADWFASSGTALDNYTLMSKYHQIATYAYVMRYEETSLVTRGYQYVRAGDHNSNEYSTLVSASASTRVVRKQRSAVNPYGSGVTWDGLNAYQSSILLALGVTRSRGAI